MRGKVRPYNGCVGAVPFTVSVGDAVRLRGVFCCDCPRSVVVSCAPLAAAGGRVSTQEWWEAARGGGLHRRCTPTRPAVRASPGMQGSRGCHASPLVQAFLSLWRSMGAPAIFIRSGQVHGRIKQCPDNEALLVGLTC